MVNVLLVTAEASFISFQAETWPEAHSRVGASLSRQRSDEPAIIRIFMSDSRHKQPDEEMTPEAWMASYGTGFAKKERQSCLHRKR